MKYVLGKLYEFTTVSKSKKGKELKTERKGKFINEDHDFLNFQLMAQAKHSIGYKVRKEVVIDVKPYKIKRVET
jgi:hypothetical protein